MQTNRAYLLFFAFWTGHFYMPIVQGCDRRRNEMYGCITCFSCCILWCGL